MSSTPRTRSGRARLSGFLASVLLPLLVAGLTPAVLRAAPETPSVVLITLDTTRADSVGQLVDLVGTAYAKDILY